MSEIDGLLAAVSGVNMVNLRNEISNLRAVRDWAMRQIGADYAEGDEVTIISPEPQQVGGGWEAHKNCLRVGSKGIVDSISFNSAADKWVANVRFADSDRGKNAEKRDIVFALNTEWVAKEPPPEEEHAPEEMALLASELHKAEGKLAFVSQCCEIIENGSEPMVPLQQVRNMLEIPHRMLEEKIKETATEGVHTPDCDCGRDGKGRSWHSTDCRWRTGLIVCDRCGHTEGEGCGCPSGPAPDAKIRFNEALSNALREWHSDVPESKDVAKNDYLAHRVTEVHAELVREMSRTA